MPLILATDAAAAAAALPALAGHLVRPANADVAPPAVLLHEAGHAGGALEQALRALLPELIAVEIGSPRFARLNFDALALLAVDLRPALLDSAGGRRLFDALGGLLREGLSLLFVGEGAAMAGARLPEAGPASTGSTGEELPPLRAGLGLLPGAAVLPDLQGGVDLRALLARLSHDRVRLLALAAPAAVRCDLDGAARFTLHGAGGALLVAFVDGSGPAGSGPAAAGSGGAAPTARLHPLTAGQAAGWPA